MRRPRPLVATAPVLAFALLSVGALGACSDDGDESVPQTGNPPSTAATTTESTADPGATSSTSDTTPDDVSATTDVDPDTGGADTSTTDLSGSGSMTDNLSGIDSTNESSRINGMDAGAAIPPPTTAVTILPPDAASPDAANPYGASPDASGLGTLEGTDSAAVPPTPT